jgi:thiol-disulfide isomerase/thioredoxin
MLAMVACADEGPAPSSTENSANTGGQAGNSQAGSSGSTTAQAGNNATNGQAGSSTTTGGSAGTGGSSSGTAGSSTSGAGGSAPSNPNWGTSYCPADNSSAPTGYDTGNQLPEIILKTCDGQDFSLNQLCGASALWIFAAHGWCPHCKQASSVAEQVHDSFAGKNVASVNILVETSAYQPPDEASCKAWREQYKMDDVLTLYDPTGATFKLWDNNYTALSVFVDKDRKIVSKSHSDTTTALQSGIEQALTQ